MRAIKVYCPPGVEPPLYAFIDALDGKLKAKLLWQIFRLRNLSACELKEPHFKHFSLERYSQMYELREKGKVLIRIVFTVQNEDVILLTSFIKRQPRDTVIYTGTPSSILQRVAAKSAEDFPVILISLVVIVLAITAAVLIWRCHKRSQEDTVYHEDFSEEEDEHEE